MMNENHDITKLPHHVQQKLCLTRPLYRQGKRLTAVKVYTVNDESQHLLICGVPKLQLGDEVKKLVAPYGDIKKIQFITEYPAEEFTEAYHVQYTRIQSARIAKRLIDGKNFFGGSLHVFYAPELESISETRAKLYQRRRDVAGRIKRNQQDSNKSDHEKFVPKEQYHRKKKTPALPLTEERLLKNYPGETLSSIYDGIPRDIDPRPVTEPSLPSTSYNNQQTNSEAFKTFKAPYVLTEPVIKAANAQEIRPKSEFNKGKRKNYKGQTVESNAKVRVVRPQIIDTSSIVKWNLSERHIFSNPKKGKSNITIKLITKDDSEKKKIVIKNPGVTQLVRPSEALQLSIQSAKSQIRAAMEARDIEKHQS